jgi:hypothetical protein
VVWIVIVLIILALIYLFWPRSTTEPAPAPASAPPAAPAQHSGLDQGMGAAGLTLG